MWWTNIEKSSIVKTFAEQFRGGLCATGNSQRRKCGISCRFWRAHSQRDKLGTRNHFSGLPNKFGTKKLILFIQFYSINFNLLSFLIYNLTYFLFDYFYFSPIKPTNSHLPWIRGLFPNDFCAYTVNCRKSSHPLYGRQNMPAYISLWDVTWTCVVPADGRITRLFY